jgi:hypothetical protein
MDDPDLPGRGEWYAEDLPPAKAVTTEDAANSYFALCVTIQRHLRPLKNDDLIARFRKFEQALKSQIATELSKTSVTLRSSFKARFKEEVSRIPERAQVIMATTNWDRGIEEWFATKTWNDARVLHVHGQVKDPATMLLPSESELDPQLSDAQAAFAKKMISGLQAAIDAADTLVVHGLSLSPLDAELAFTLWMGLHPFPGKTSTPKTIKLINRKCQERPLRTRVELLLPRNWDPAQVIQFEAVPDAHPGCCVCPE